MPIRKMVFAAAALLPLASLASCLPAEDECPDPECAGALVLLEYSTSRNGMLPGGTLVVCHNARCNFETIVEDGAAFQGLGLALPVDEVVRLESWAFGARGVEVRIDLGASDNAVDGDTYSMELRDRDDVLVASKIWRATAYRDGNPFGPECGSITCRTVVLE